MATTYEPDPSSQPLAGIRAVEVGFFHAGPIATGMLGSLGAEVIKIEDPKSPDPVRISRRLYGQDASLPNGSTTAFEAYNAGKKGIALNLKHPEGMKVLHRLLAKSDVFLHNIRGDAADRLGIDYDSLVKVKPDLVYAALSGFGPQGAESKRPGLDPVGLARSGALTVVSGGSRREPFLPASGLADRISGMVLGFGIVSALLARDRTGKPQKVETSLIGGAMWLAHLNLQHALLKGAELLPTNPSQEPLLSNYQCADQRWIFIAAMVGEAWKDLFLGLEMPELLGDARFETTESRWQNRADMAKILIGRFASKSSDYWVESFSRQPNLVFERVQRPTDIADDPQLLTNNYLVELDDAKLGRHKRIALPLHVNGRPGGRVAPSPGVGQHTTEVLGSLLGMGAAEIEALKNVGAA